MRPDFAEGDASSPVGRVTAHLAYTRPSTVLHLYQSIMATPDGGAYRYAIKLSLKWQSDKVHVYSTSYSLTVFSPSGKLVQIEHALAAVAQGTTSLGIKGTQTRPIQPIAAVMTSSIQQRTAS